MKRKNQACAHRLQRGIITVEMLAWLVLLLMGLWQTSANLVGGGGTSSNANAVLPSASPSPVPSASPTPGGGLSGGGTSNGGGSNSGGGTTGGGGTMSVTPEAPALVQLLPGLLPLGFILARRARRKA